MLAANGETFSFGLVTAAADTAFSQFIPPRGNKRTKLTQVKYKCGATVHSVTVLRHLGGKRKLTQAQAAADTTITVDKDPGNYSANWAADGLPGTPSTSNNLIGANDIIACLKTDGTWFVTTVSSVTTNADGTVTITPASAVPTGGVSANAPFYFFGITTDTDPRTGNAHPKSMTIVVSSVNDWANGSAGTPIAQSHAVNEPLLVYSNNITAQGWIEQSGGFYAV